MTWTGPITLIILFLVSHFNYLFIPCGRLSWLPVRFLLHVKYTLSYRIVCKRGLYRACIIIIINGDGGCKFWQPVQADSQPKSSGLVLGRRSLGAVLHSSNEPGELSQWLCHDDSTINIVLVIIIFIITETAAAATTTGTTYLGSDEWIALVDLAQSVKHLGQF